MALAFDFAVRLGLASGQDATPRAAAYRRRRAADRAWLARTCAAGRRRAAVAHMGKDKKVRDGSITLILPRRIGDAFVMRDASAEALRDFLAEAA